jgi:3',5'-cyclic AMP phosphodiesterase CpdA
MVNLGGSRKLWEEWFEDMSALMSEVPFMPVMGNHDNSCNLSSGLCPRMFEQFALPDNDVPGKKEYWYSFDVAGAHFTMLNSEKEAGIGPESDQYIWLEDDLEQNGNAEWKFAFMHKPPFSLGAHGDDEEVKKNWVPLFDKYGVDIVFSGHEHLYERTKPLKNFMPSEEGTTYIVSGSSGSYLYPHGNKKNTPEGSFFEIISSRYCYIRANVKADTTEINTIAPIFQKNEFKNVETIDSYLKKYKNKGS